VAANISGIGAAARQHQAASSPAIREILTAIGGNQWQHEKHAKSISAA